MIILSSLRFPAVRLRAIAGSLFLVFGAACSGSGEATAPTTEASLPEDSTASITPVDSTALPGDSTMTPLPPGDSSGVVGLVAALDNRSSLPGIVFATDGMDNKYFNKVYTGSKRGGGVTEDNVLPLLSDAKAKGARIVLKLSMGRDSYIQNADGTFSLTKWKALVDRFRSVNLGPYIADGTIVGHFLIDEPHRAAKWGGKIIPQSTVEAMALYSKQIWPTMNTFVHTQMSWLASSPLTYTSLDAGWVQYAANKGDVTRWVTGEISGAKSKGLGLVVGLNVLNGGNGSSGSNAMSAKELSSYGTVLLNQSYACGFTSWAHDLTYYGRSDIQSALANLSNIARAHAKTACRQ
jgi:hypothetical protein